MPSLLIASKNPHKIAELRALLGAAWVVEGSDQHPEFPAPAETGSTFAENARIKALALASRVGDALVLADDSGLQVDALDGAPGVHSARYAGEYATDAENRGRLLAELPAGVEPLTARFRCALAIARGLEVLGVFEGAVEGRVIREERGAGGFGYDSLFIPAGHEQTFAELPGEVKNQHSHRGQALAQAQGFLAGLPQT